MSQTARASTAAAAPQHVDVKPYLLVFGALAILTVATVLVSYFDWSPWLTIFVGLMIATVKASLVAAFFMHLKGERLIIYGLLGLCVVFCISLFAIPISDSRGNAGRMIHTPVVVEETQAPAEAPVAPPQKP